jgi:hypothetical protein
MQPAADFSAAGDTMSDISIPDERDFDDYERVLVGLDVSLFIEVKHTVQNTGFASVEEFVGDAVAYHCGKYVTEVPPRPLGCQSHPETHQEAFDNLRERIGHNLHRRPPYRYPE